MGSSTAYVMTISNSIIGVSVLAMPFCYKQCGIVLSSFLLLLSNILSRSTCHFLLKSAIMSRRRNYELLAFHVFGTMGKTFVELSIIGFMMGTCIAFFVVMGDLGPAILSNVFTHVRLETLRPTVLMGIAIFIVLPLGLLRNVDSLSAVSTATILFYLCLVLKMLAESSTHLIEGDWLSEVDYWNPGGLLQCLPIFSMALFCQTQLFDIFESTPNLPLDRMNKYIGSAVNMCTGVYMSVGFFGYVAYYKLTNLSGNVLLSFSPNASSEIIKCGFVLSVAVSFPLVIFPCRASIYSFLFRKGHSPHYESVTHNSVVAGSSHIPEARFRCITLFIIFVSLLTALMATNIELVLGLVGATIGVLICVLLPTYIFVTLSGKYTTERLYAKILFVVGLCIMFLGTYANLMATEKVAQVTPLPSMFMINEDSNKGEIMKLAESVRLNKNFMLQDVDSKIEKPNLESKPPEVNKMRLDYDRKLKEDKRERKKASGKISANFEDKIRNNDGQVEGEKGVVHSAVNPNITKGKEKTLNNPVSRKEELINNEAIRKEEKEAQNEISANTPSSTAATHAAQNHEMEILEKLKKQEEEQKKIMKQQEAILKEVIKQNRQLEEIKAKDEMQRVEKKNEENVQSRVENLPDAMKSKGLEVNGLVRNPGKSVSNNLISEKIQELNENIRELNRDEIQLTNQIDKVKESILREDQIGNKQVESIVNKPQVDKVPDSVVNQKLELRDGDKKETVDNNVGLVDKFNKPIVERISEAADNAVPSPDNGHNGAASLNIRSFGDQSAKTVDKKLGDTNGDLNNIESPPNEVSRVPRADNKPNVFNEAFIEVEKDLSNKINRSGKSIGGLANPVPIALMLQPTKNPAPPVDIVKTRDILEDVRREKRDVRQEPANPVPPEYEVMKRPVAVLESVDQLLEKVKQSVEMKGKVGLEKESVDKQLDSGREHRETKGVDIENQFSNKPLEISKIIDEKVGVKEPFDEPLIVSRQPVNPMGVVNEPVDKTLENVNNVKDTPLEMVKESVDRPVKNMKRTADELLKNTTVDKPISNRMSVEVGKPVDSVLGDKRISKNDTSNELISNNKSRVLLGANNNLISGETLSNPASVQNIEHISDIVNEHIPNDLNIVNSRSSTNVNDSNSNKNVPENLGKINNADIVQSINENDRVNEIRAANIDANNQSLHNGVETRNESSDSKIAPDENSNQNEKCDAKGSEDIRVPQLLSNVDHEDIIRSLTLDDRFRDHVIHNIAADKT